MGFVRPVVKDSVPVGEASEKDGRVDVAEVSVVPEIGVPILCEGELEAVEDGSDERRVVDDSRIVVPANSSVIEDDVESVSKRVSL